MIATGLFPGANGVIGHRFLEYSVEKKYYYIIDDLVQIYNKSRYEFKAYPIWSRNEDNGGTSLVSMWPGGDFPYGPKNTAASIRIKYNSKTSIRERFDEVIKWLKNETVKINLVMMYIENPDKLAHVYGPDSKNVTEIIIEIDTEIGNFLKELDEIKSKDYENNIIILSDHGMDGIPFKNFAKINKSCYKIEDKMFLFGDFNWFIIVNVTANGPLKKVRDCVLKFIPYIDTYSIDHFVFHDCTKEFCIFPDFWKTRFPKDTYSIIAKYSSDDKVFFEQNKWRFERWKKEFNVDLTTDPERIIGTHGSLSTRNDAFLMARGPAFKTGEIDLVVSQVTFTVIAKILKIDISDQKRSAGYSVNAFLKNDGKKTTAITDLAVVKPKCIYRLPIDWSYHITLIATMACFTCTCIYIAGNMMYEAELLRNGPSSSRRRTNL